MIDFQNMRLGPYFYELIDISTTLKITKNLSEVDISFEEFKEVEKLTVILTEDGSLKTYRDHMDTNKIKENVKNVICHRNILSNQKILLFVSTGRVYTIDPNILPSGKFNPKNFIFYVDLNSHVKLIGILAYKQNLKCIVASKFGKGFIADLNNIQTNQKKR